jgi:hypothetical protein
MHLIHSTFELASVNRPATQTAAMTDLLRRADWRFLLPNPNPRTVWIIGEETKTLVQACKYVFKNTLHASPGLCLPHGSADLTVADDLSPTLLQQIFDQVDPNSVIYAELPEKVAHRAFRQISALRRQFAAAGFAEVEFRWHYPDFERCTQIFSLNEPESIRWYAARRGRTISRMASIILGMAANIGLLPYVAKSVSVIATRDL